MEPPVLAEEHAALRRVATLVAVGAAPEEVFAAVIEEVGQLLGVEYAGLNRYEPDGAAATIVAVWSRRGQPAPPVRRQQILGGRNVVTTVFQTGRAARIDGYLDAAGPFGVAAREHGIGSGVGAPIVVEGRLWGVMSIYSTPDQPPPADTEERLASFAELVAAAIANTESRAGLARLAEEQAALRRVAVLVAGGTPQEELFAAVSGEIGRLLPVDFAIMGRYEDDGTVTCVAAWGAPAVRFPVGSRSKLEGSNLVTMALESGRPARVDHFEHASGRIGVVGRESGFHSAVAAPITVEGRQWGVMTVGSTLRQPTLPADTEARLASFTELVAMAVANAESRAGLARLVEEQAALRHVATLVARGLPPQELFTAVVEEVCRLLSVEYAHLGRYEPDGAVTFVAAWGDADAVLPAGTRLTLGGRNVSTLVSETGRSARIDSYRDASGPSAVAARERGVGSSVGTPIVVEGRMWGVMVVGSSAEQPLPADTEARLTSFTELLATAIANAQSHAGLARLAEEQAALRRVATLVARGTPQRELLAAVTEEIGRLLRVEYTYTARYDPDEMITVVGVWGGIAGRAAVGSRRSVGGRNLVTIVSETARSARIDKYDDASGPLGVGARQSGVRSAVGSPILVEGRVWGVVIAGSRTAQLLPAETEARLGSFTALVATAIANAESRTGLARIAEEQAALRRVATLVARGVHEQELFAAVTEEIGRLLPVEYVLMGRYEPDATCVVVAGWTRAGDRAPLGTRLALGGRNLATIVFETGRPARIDGFTDASGPLGVAPREAGVRAAVGTPITAEARLWGVVIAGSTIEDDLPADVEARLASFTALVATAIANAESRVELTASRARIVAAADETRRRIERDLHDGAQQRLVHAVIVLKLALRAQASGDANAAELVAEALRHAEEANSELRELAHGILPAALTRGGLRAGVEALVSRASVPVSVDVSTERLPAGVEATAYFVISEALTNVVKHARADGAEVMARVEHGELRVEIRDDGVGGARGGDSTGLTGLEDRVAALGGTLALESPRGGGTRVRASLPVPGHG